MEQLNYYLEQLIAKSARELHLRPNANPFVVSTAGNTDIGNVPLQGSQISMMVFPLIPMDVKQELPNKPQVEFVHPSSIGEFNFTVQKSAAGFNVTITPVTGSTETPPAAQVYETPELEQPVQSAAETDSFPAIDLQPIDEFADPTLRDDFGSGADIAGVIDNIPDPDAENGPPQSAVSFSNAAPAFGEISVEDLVHTAQEYVPPPSAETAHLPAEQVIKTPIADRRSSQRLGSNSEMKDRMEFLFHAMAESGASDMHLSVGMPPMMRKDGRMLKLECAEDSLSAGLMTELLYSIMPERNKEEFSERHGTHFACEVPGLARFRTNVFTDRKGMGAAFRIVPAELASAEQLGLPDAVMSLCDFPAGLVVVTGPAGSGRSTTLSAMVNRVNATREGHIITIEDPVEFVHENIKCLVNQRQVGSHTSSFADVLRAAYHEDPDVVLVGDIRDPETLSAAIETAETGRLVLGALHAATAASAVDRMTDQFPADRQAQGRAALSRTLRAVVAQTLVPNKTGGRTATFEVLHVTPEISNLIREGKTSDIISAV